MASVTHRVTEDGTHEIGVKDKGVFVVFASLDAARHAQLAEAEVNRGGGEKPGGSSEPEGTPEPGKESKPDETKRGGGQ